MDDNYLRSLDEHFMAQYADYSRIGAIQGYETPDLIDIGRDGNIRRKGSEIMRLVHQKNREELLARFKEGLIDTDFSFSFSFVSLIDRLRDRFHKQTFSKLLPAILAHSGETTESVGKKLSLDEKIWTGIVKGKLYPEKNTVLAIALVARVTMQDAVNLLALCGFSLEADSVRDVVVEYLLAQKVFNEEMRDNCLKEYKITSLPIRSDPQSKASEIA